MLQQDTVESQPRLAVQVNSAVSLDKTRMVIKTLSHHFVSSWYIAKHISHTCRRISCRRARYLSGSTHSEISMRCLATAHVSSSIATGHYVLNKNVDPKHLGFENNEGNATSSYYCCSTTCSGKLCLYFSWTACFAFVEDSSYSFGSLAEEVEVLEDPSTWTNLSIFEPGTNDRDCESSIVVFQSFRTDHVFCTSPT